MSIRVGEDLGIAGLKIAPAAGAMALGLTLNEWVAVATLIYLILQGGYLVWKWHRDWERAQAEAADREAEE